MAVILAITILGTGLIGSYTTVPAAEFSAGAIAAGETLEWITAALAGAGISISVKELLKPRQAEIEKDIGKHIDWDNYDWGDALDSPAAQDQIDELDKTINKLYGNASAKWKEMYEKSLSPTPTPETSPDKPDPSPPVTVAPIDPDKVTPPDWDTLKNMSRHNGFIPLEVGTFWCLKEAVKGLWDDCMDNTPPTTKLNGNPLAANSKDLVGKVTVNYSWASGTGCDKFFIYNTHATIPSYAGFDVDLETVSGNVQEMDLHSCAIIDGKVDYSGSKNFYVAYYARYSDSDGQNSDYFNSSTWSVNVDASAYSGIKSTAYSYQFYVPYLVNGVLHNADTKPVDKNALWVNPDLKSDYDNNKSPSLPDTAPAPAIKVPTMDEIKDLQKKANNADDERRPVIIQDFVTNHYTTPSVDPNPKPNPDPNPNPNPDPNP